MPRFSGAFFIASPARTPSAFWRNEPERVEGRERLGETNPRPGPSLVSDGALLLAVVVFFLHEHRQYAVPKRFDVDEQLDLGGVLFHHCAILEHAQETF